MERSGLGVTIHQLARVLPCRGLPRSLAMSSRNSYRISRTVPCALPYWIARATANLDRNRPRGRLSDCVLINNRKRGACRAGISLELLSYFSHAPNTDVTRIHVYARYCFGCALSTTASTIRIGAFREVRALPRAAHGWCSASAARAFAATFEPLGPSEAIALDSFDRRLVKTIRRATRAGSCWTACGASRALPSCVAARGSRRASITAVAVCSAQNHC